MMSNPAILDINEQHMMRQAHVMRETRVLSDLDVLVYWAIVHAAYNDEPTPTASSLVTRSGGAMLENENAESIVRLGYLGFLPVVKETRCLVTAEGLAEWQRELEERHPAPASMAFYREQFVITRKALGL